MSAESAGLEPGGLEPGGTGPGGTGPVGNRSGGAPHRARKTPTAVFIGFMGAGKSTVGRIVADRFGVDFVDADQELERRLGRTIPEIFDTDGAQAFREMEHDVVVDLLEANGPILSLGGGAVTTPAIAEALRDHRVVYLKIDAESGFERVRGSDRPLLAGQNPEATYRELLDARATTYDELATITVDASADDPEVVADEIVTEIARLVVGPRRTPEHDATELDSHDRPRHRRMRDR